MVFFVLLGSLSWISSSYRSGSWYRGSWSWFFLLMFAIRMTFFFLVAALTLLDWLVTVAANTQHASYWGHTKEFLSILRSSEFGQSLNSWLESAIGVLRNA